VVEQFHHICMHLSYSTFSGHVDIDRHHTWCVDHFLSTWFNLPDIRCSFLSIHTTHSYCHSLALGIVFVLSFCSSSCHLYIFTSSDKLFIYGAKPISLASSSAHNVSPRNSFIDVSSPRIFVTINKALRYYCCSHKSQI